MSTEPNGAANEPVGLFAEAYPGTLLLALGLELRGRTIDVMRGAAS